MQKPTRPQRLTKKVERDVYPLTAVNLFTFLTELKKQGVDLEKVKTRYEDYDDVMYFEYEFPEPIELYKKKLKDYAAKLQEYITFVEKNKEKIIQEAVSRTTTEVVEAQTELSNLANEIK